MAKLYITEYQDLPRDAKGIAVMCGNEIDGGGIDQTPVDYTSGAAQSAAFAADTKFVRVHTDAICSIKFGANPTATTNSKRMAAGTTEFFGVRGGQKVSAISNT